MVLRTVSLWLAIGSALYATSAAAQAAVPPAPTELAPPPPTPTVVPPPTVAPAPADPAPPLAFPAQPPPGSVPMAPSSPPPGPYVAPNTPPQQTAAPPYAIPPGWALVPIPPPVPVQPPPPPREQRFERDDRWMTLGVGPLLLGNVHWLDKPEDKSVAVRNSRSRDDMYPGFTGTDATIGVMIDLRFWHFIGVELDLFRQNDRGHGDVTIKDTGDICILPSVAIPYSSSEYRLTIGQYAWHLPLLLKISIPGRKVVVRNEEEGANGKVIDVDREIRKWFTTFALGPEFVIPGDAKLEVSPKVGLDYPKRATVSSYVMVTGAFGFEHRVSDRHDIRILFSLRGSYNPGPGESSMKRGEYVLSSGRIVPLAYKSEWRYQAALTFGAGWFF